LVDTLGLLLAVVVHSAAIQDRDGAKLVFLKAVNRDNQHLFAKPGMKSGQTINVRLPARFVGRTGEGYKGASKHD